MYFDYARYNVYVHSNNDTALNYARYNEASNRIYPCCFVSSCYLFPSRSNRVTGCFLCLTYMKIKKAIQTKSTKKAVTLLLLLFHMEKMQVTGCCYFPPNILLLSGIIYITCHKSFILSLVFDCLSDCNLKKHSKNGF